MKHLSELCTVTLLNLFVEILDDLWSDPLLDLIELLSDSFDFELRLMQLSLSLLKLGLECLLSDLEAADFDVEVFLLLIERQDLCLLDGGGLSDRLSECWYLVLRVSGHHKRGLSLLCLLLTALELDEVNQLLLRECPKSFLSHIIILFYLLIIAESLLF